MKTLSIDLNSIEELFQEKEFNPFNPDSRCESGVADLYNQTQDLSPSSLFYLKSSFTCSRPELELSPG
jgi:hypothetical protein